MKNITAFLIVFGVLGSANAAVQLLNQATTSRVFIQRKCDAMDWSTARGIIVHVTNSFNPTHFCDVNINDQFGQCTLLLADLNCHGGMPGSTSLDANILYEVDVTIHNNAFMAQKLEISWMALAIDGNIFLDDNCLPPSGCSVDGSSLKEFKLRKKEVLPAWPF